MKIEILQEKENKPLSRREIEFRVEHIGSTTPSRADVLAKIVAQFDADSSAVVIRSLNTKFGIGITEGTARIYSDAEQMKRVELGYVLKRHASTKKEES
ncbi:MAG: 30S ribosomal protein S24e [Candidatus Thorarchaeota archaeon]|nr:MAG: 30S ribosomal protein S24e [Candidatus Thorarchaeota archaeon]